MILSFQDKDTERFYQGERGARFQAIQRQIEQRLRILAAAPIKEALHMPSSNRFKALEQRPVR